jgi:hypothetical protein
MGVAIVSDIFMEAIEYITSQVLHASTAAHRITLVASWQERTLKTRGGATISVRIWNATVANLTLMALG